MNDPQESNFINWRRIMCGFRRIKTILMEKCTSTLTLQKQSGVGINSSGRALAEHVRGTGVATIVQIFSTFFSTILSKWLKFVFEWGIISKSWHPHLMKESGARFAIQ